MSLSSAYSSFWMRNIRKSAILLSFLIVSLCVVYATFWFTSRTSMSGEQKYIMKLNMFPQTKPPLSNSSITNPSENYRDYRDSSSYWDSLLTSNTLTGAQIMKYFMWSNRSSCRLTHDFGGKILQNPSGKDGQKAVCIDPQVAPQPGTCLVYSFGIHNEWSFDEEMEQYGCEVFAFDPSMEMDPHDHTPGIHFYNWGLSDRDEIEARDNVTKWRMYSLSSVYDKLSARHGRKVIDYLKMDIERSEWKVLPHIIKTGMLSKVRQLGIELHLPEWKSIEEFRELIQIVRSLEKMGMVRFDSKYNPWTVANFTKLSLYGSFIGHEIAWYNSLLLM